MAKKFQHFPNTQLHILWSARCSSDKYIYRWNARVQVHLWLVYFLVLLVVFLSWKNTFWFFAFVWEVHFPGDYSDLGFGEPSVFRGGLFSDLFSPKKMIELWAKNRILEADLFAFDRDASVPFQISWRQTTRLVHTFKGFLLWYKHIDISGDMPYFGILLPATSCMLNISGQF